MNAHAPTDHWIVHPQGRMHARMWAGERDAATPPLVLLHDSLGCVELWRTFPAALAQATGRRVIAYDRLGFGRSDALPGRVGADFIEAEARDRLPHVLSHFAVDRVALLGHSVGGAMAVEAAAALGDRCESLITIAAQAFVEPITLSGIVTARAQFADPGEVARLGRYHGEKARWVLDAWIETWLDPAFANWTLVRTLPRVRCPVLAIHGDRDEYGSIAHPTLIRDRSGGTARRELLADTGHVPHRERMDATVRLVASWLTASPSSIGA